MIYIYIYIYVYILKIQLVDFSIVYDALELPFDMVDITNIFKLNNSDIVQSIHIKAARNGVYNKHEIDLRFSGLIGAAPAVLDIVVEPAAAFGDDQTYAMTIQSQIIIKADKITTYFKL